MEIAHTITTRVRVRAWGNRRSFGHRKEMFCDLTSPTGADSSAVTAHRKPLAATSSPSSSLRNTSANRQNSWAARRFASSSYTCSRRRNAPGTVEGRMSALRFLYKKTLRRRDITYDDLVFPKTPRKLPVVLSGRDGRMQLM